MGTNWGVRANLLELDTDLGRYLAPDSVRALQRSLQVEVIGLQPGTWQPPAAAPEPGHLGFLVVEGMLVRSVAVDSSRSGELIARGDVIRPWVEDPVSFCEADWRVMEPTRIAVLDRATAARMCSRPELNAALLDRQMERSRSLAISAAIENVRRLDQRLLILFWHLAERWGRRERGRVVMPLKLTHATLALLAGARRPSVTTALSDLSAQGTVTRAADGTWILSGSPPAPTPRR
jgi:CRP/FNR family cyclic AMP-dependent transcriptional regulator